MRKILVGLFIVLGFSGYAQYNWDYGLNLGLTNYMGDIGGPAAEPIRVQMGRTNVGAGLFLRHKLSHLISIKGSFNYIRISGADSLSESPGRKARNLQFRNAIYEFIVTPEIHLYQTKDFGRSGRYNTFLNAYVFGGVGLAYHNPQAELNDKWIDLQPLQTEGTNYSQMIPVIPVGIGAHMTFNRRIRIGAELGIRITMTDYLDDISENYLTKEEVAERGSDANFVALQDRTNFTYIDQNQDLFPVNYRRAQSGGGIRGNSDSNDWYFFGNVSVGYVIKGNSNFYRSRYSYSRGRKKKRRRSRAKF